MKIVTHTFSHKEPFTQRKATNRIILHCSATPDGRDVTVEQIDRDHKARNYNCIGYNYVIYRDGTIHTGRPEHVVGAHTTGSNSTSIGVCYIGGMNKEYTHSADTRTEAQKLAMYELIDELLTRYKLSIEDVYPHYFFAKKACPSFKIEDFRAEYEEWKINHELFYRCNLK